MIKPTRLRWAGHVARMKEDKIFTGTPTGKKPLGKPRHRLGDNNRMDLKEMGVNK